MELLCVVLTGQENPNFSSHYKLRVCRILRPSPSPLQNLAVRVTSSRQSCHSSHPTPLQSNMNTLVSALALALAVSLSPVSAAACKDPAVCKQWYNDIFNTSTCPQHHPQHPAHPPLRSRLLVEQRESRESYRQALRKDWGPEALLKDGTGLRRCPQDADTCVDSATTCTE